MQKSQFTWEVEILTSPLDLAAYKNAITEAMFKGTKRNVESEDEGIALKKHISRVDGQHQQTDAETFTRLLYYGTVQMGMSSEEFWLMPIGLFLDLWTCHKQWHGIEKPKKTRTIDDIIPLGI